MLKGTSQRSSFSSAEPGQPANAHFSRARKVFQLEKCAYGRLKVRPRASNSVMLSSKSRVRLLGSVLRFEARVRTACKSRLRLSQNGRASTKSRTTYTSISTSFARSVLSRAGPL